MAILNQDRSHSPVGYDLLEDSPICGVVVHYQDGHAAEHRRVRADGSRRGVFGLKSQLGYEMESAAFTDFTLDPDLAIHHFDELRRYG